MMIDLMYRSFGQQTPADLVGGQRAVIWLLALAFVTSSLAMLAVFNFCSLFLGVWVNFLGRDGVKFTFLHLFRTIPLIGVTPPIFALFFARHTVAEGGVGAFFAGPAVTAISAIVLIAATVAANKLIGRRVRR